jgi:aminopeptidase
MENKNDSNFFDSWLFRADRRGPELVKAAEIAIADVLQVKKGERVLIVTNPEQNVARISAALYDAAWKAGAETTLMVQPVKTQLEFAEKAVIQAIESEPDVFISMSAEKLGKDYKRLNDPYEKDGQQFISTFHYLLWGKRSLRAFWSPSITEELFIHTVPVDYRGLKTRCRTIKEVLDKAVSVLVTAGGGTEIEIGIDGRSAFSDDGDFSGPGKGGNLPAGEVFISPSVGTASGRIVFDGSIAVERGALLLEGPPIRATVENGFITEITGGAEADVLKAAVTRAESDSFTFEKEGRLKKGQAELYAKNARNIGELGIGLNPAARLEGNMLIDEKAFNTCHFAIGHNYDRDAPALIHLDGVVRNPTIIAVNGAGERTIILERGVPAL